MPSYGALRSKSRFTAAQAGYMELAGAVKDADCLKVLVPDGISSDLGCCNEYQPEAKDTKRFRCGECEYKTEMSGVSNRYGPMTKGTRNKFSVS